MNIKKTWESTITSRGADASVFNIEKGSLYPADMEHFAQNLDLLNERIYSIHKELTYWNLYKITSAVNSSENLENVVASLAPGEACIINSPTFTKQDTTFSRGDILVKLTSNEIIHIVALNGGIYYPSTITSNGNGSYNLEYKFINAEPTPGSTQTVSAGEEAEPAEVINFQNLAAAQGEYIYGGYYQLGNTGYVDIKKIFINNGSEDRVVFPVIKFFWNKEEITIPYTVTDTTISSQPAWRITYSGYNSSIFGNNLFMQVK